jgi:radical SAM superfamily enzyme
LKTLAHVILGLPGEGRDEIRATADRLARLPMHGIKIHHLYVAKDTPLAATLRRGGLHPLSPEAHASLAVDFLERTLPSVVVARLVSDPDPTLLLAPRWERSKAEVLGLIRAEFEARGTRQGVLAGPSASPGGSPG